MSFRRYNHDMGHYLSDNSPGLNIIEGNKYMTRIDTSGSNIHASGHDNIRYQGNGIPHVMVQKLGRISQQTERTDIRSPSNIDLQKQTLNNDSPQ